MEGSKFNGPINGDVRKFRTADTDKNALYHRSYSPYLVQSRIAEQPAVPATQMYKYNCKDRSIKTRRKHFRQYSGADGNVTLDLTKAK